MGSIEWIILTVAGFVVVGLCFWKLIQSALRR
jgi:hypothetical protein